MLKHDINQVYKINYASKLYQDEKNILSESMYGCKYNCFYCHYRYSTLPPNLRKKIIKLQCQEETFLKGGFRNKEQVVSTQAV